MLGDDGGQAFGGLQEAGVFAGSVEEGLGEVEGGFEDGGRGADHAQRGDGVHGPFGGLLGVGVGREVGDGHGAAPGRRLAAWGALWAEGAGRAGAQSAPGGRRGAHAPFNELGLPR